MADVLPVLFAVATGVALCLVLLAFWSSFRGLFAQDAGARRAGSHDGTARAALLREKETLLAAIRELRLEHELGKVSDADFERLDRRYRTRAKEVLRELDAQIAPYRPEAEALLAKALGKGGAAEAAQSEPEPSKERSGAGLVCGKCQTRNDADAVFCKKCGAELVARVQA